MNAGQKLRGFAVKHCLEKAGYTATMKDGFLTVDGTSFGVSFDCPSASYEILTNYNRDGSWNGLKNAIAYSHHSEVADAVVKKIKWAARQK